MKYPAQSDIWRLSLAAGVKPLNGYGGKSRVLARFRQIFPLALLPGELIIEELRIVHVKKYAPWSSQIISIMATDIACVNASSGPFFGHVHVQSLTGGPQIFIDNLLRRDVFKIRSLVEGIALASREGLNISEKTDLEAEKESLLAAGSLH